MEECEQGGGLGTLWAKAPCLPSRKAEQLRRKGWERWNQGLGVGETVQGREKLLSFVGSIQTHFGPFAACVVP